jgi:hypothetical protein
LKPIFRLFCGISTLVGITWLASATQAQVTKVGNGYQFRVKYHKGMKVKYLMKVTSGMPVQSAGGKAQSIVIVIPVSGVVTDMQNKIATVQMTTGPNTFNGKTQGAQQNITIKVDDRGKVVSGAPNGMENMTIALPDKPLKVGDTFTAHQNVNMGVMPLTVNAVYKFTGMKSVGGHQLAMFAVTLTGTGNVPSPQGASVHLSTAGTGQMSISAEDGMTTLVNIDQTVTVPQGAQTLKLKTSTRFERQ